MYPSLLNIQVSVLPPVIGCGPLLVTVVGAIMAICPAVASLMLSWCPVGTGACLRWM